LGERKESMGYVADFCPLCRQVRPFRLQYIGLAGHVYYVALGHGELIGHQKQCTACKSVLDADPEAYREICRRKLDPETLRERTFPNLARHYAYRLEVEKKLGQSSGALSPQERLNLIREPFALLAPTVEERFSQTHIDRETGLTLLAALVLLPVAGRWANKWWPTSPDTIVLGLLALGLAAVVIQALRSGPRFFKRKIFPVLVPALRPLKPTPDELTAILADFKRAQVRLGTRLKVSALLAQLEGSHVAR
jgi:hypothetical protein